jgi:hypothetical protein
VPPFPSKRDRENLHLSHCLLCWWLNYRVGESNDGFPLSGGMCGSIQEHPVLFKEERDRLLSASSNFLRFKHSCSYFWSRTLPASAAKNKLHPPPSAVLHSRAQWRINLPRPELLLEIRSILSTLTVPPNISDIFQKV